MNKHASLIVIPHNSRFGTNCEKEGADWIFGFADLANFRFGFSVFALKTAVFRFWCLVLFALRVSSISVFGFRFSPTMIFSDFLSGNPNNKQAYFILL